MTTDAHAEARAIALAECPIGLFISQNGELCLKTEYRSNEGRIDAYIVASGEFFWGGANTVQDQRNVPVTPYDHAAALAAKDAELVRLREFERAHDYCCCGDRVDAHSMGSGHSPVSVYDYQYSRAIERAERAEAQLAEANKALGQVLEELKGEPEYHAQGMGCGLEDRSITDRYEAMEHGWECAMERVYAEHINPARETARRAREQGGQ